MGIIWKKFISVLFRMMDFTAGDFTAGEWNSIILSIKKRQFLIYKTCFDILVSVANELLTVVHFNFIVRYVTKLRVKTCATI